MPYPRRELAKRSNQAEYCLSGNSHAMTVNKLVYISMRNVERNIVEMIKSI